MVCEPMTLYVVIRLALKSRASRLGAFVVGMFGVVAGIAVGIFVVVTALWITLSLA